VASRKEYVSLVVVAAILAAALFLVHTYAEDIRQFIEDHPVSGVIVYLLLNIADAVVAPGATLPLIPVVANAWGHIPASLATTAGWTMGSLVAFFIARRWGAPLVRKLTSIERVKRLKRFIPKHLFWSVVLLRAVMPMDVISYALGLFTDMKWSEYAAATALGLAPSAFLLVYLGRTPRAYTMMMVIIVAAVVASLVYSATLSPTRRRRARA
jgi:uncharacterized membrane protein YdjX (TVP38/TMEM64 family)